MNKLEFAYDTITNLLAKIEELEKEVNRMETLTRREEAIMQEAFITGRIYTNMGEKESPVDIQKKLESNCFGAIKNLKKRLGVW